jgi:hypothetical protein
MRDPNRDWEMNESTTLRDTIVSCLQIIKRISTIGGFQLVSAEPPGSHPVFGALIQSLSIGSFFVSQID